MSACTFFGHRDCYGLDAARLRDTLEDLIARGVDTFYVGHQGRFDAMAFRILQQLEQKYAHLSVMVVLATLPRQKSAYDAYTLYPEGMESVPPRFAVDRRNHWMLDRSDYCVCYVNHPWGGAYKYMQRARRSMPVINLGSATL